MGSPVSQLAVESDRTIYAATTSAQTLFAIEPDGEPKWEFLAGGTLFAAPRLGVSWVPI